MNRKLSAVALLIGSLISGSALAAVFPDVPAGHRFQEAIEQLQAAGVIQGNPDGLFSPDRTVNRAEMLAMLYRSVGVVPVPTTQRCFPDVDPASWYAPVVCDAAVRGFVKGYADGNFRPGNTVNRVEALKMVMEVLGFGLGGVTLKDRDLVKFVDVSVSAWYSDYWVNAYRMGILPIPGQSGARFEPEMGLSRGEAAAYIWNAIKVKLDQLRQSSSAASSVSSGSGAQSSQRSSVQTVFDVPTYPINVSGKFTEKMPMAYRFTFTEAKVVSVTTRLQSTQQGKIRCTLFKQEPDDLPFEYYIGVQDGNTCHLLTKLSPGTYQLQVEPTIANVTFTAEVNTGVGDGNDGFSEAQPIYFNTPKNYSLGRANLQNWYHFTVTASEGQLQTLELTNAQDLTCIIHPMSNVDIFGFEYPECNHSYLFPPGTYYVGVGRQHFDGDQESYTIRLIPSS